MYEKVSVHLPANKISLSQAHLEAVSPGGGSAHFLDKSEQRVAVHAVETPGPFAWLYSQAGFLSVDREHGELRLGQRPWKHIRWKIRFISIFLS